jgi:hypothetical protein
VPKELDPNAILVAEFEYIAQAIAQNNEDRARVSSYYMITVGSFIAAILSAQFEVQDASTQFWLNMAFGGLFAVLGLSGLVTLLQLARFRLAWFDAAEAMYQIIDYYQDTIPEGAFKAAFRWGRTKGRLPKRLRLWSVSFLFALQVAALSGATLAAAVQFVRAAFGQVSATPLPFIIGFVAVFLELAGYAQILHQEDIKEAQETALPKD